MIVIEKIKSYAFPYAFTIIAVETLVIILLCWILWGTHKANTHSVPVASQDSAISRVTVTVYVPLKGLDKKEAHGAGIIAKDVAKDEDKAVLASGQVKDDSGSRSLAAVLDVKKGETQIVEKRPFAEFMKRVEIGAGYGYESGDESKVAQLRATIGRLDKIYLTGQFEIFEVERFENRHPWNAVALINFRFSL